MLMITPRAPFTDAPSSSGLEIAPLRRLDRAVLALGDAGAHHRHAHAGHDRLHVGEIEVDQPGHEDQIGDPLDRLTQHVVGGGERFESSASSRSMIVSSRSLGIVMIVSTQSRSASRPRSACSEPLLAFELERLGHDGHRERAELARQAGDDRRGAGPGAAAEAGGHEDHVGAVERLNDAFGVLERRLAADVRDRRRRRGLWSACCRSAA